MTSGMRGVSRADSPGSRSLPSSLDEATRPDGAAQARFHADADAALADQNSGSWNHVMHWLRALGELRSAA